LLISTAYNVAYLILPVHISVQSKIKEEPPATEAFLRQKNCRSHTKNVVKAMK
jgi:hypothetical protein